MTDKEAGKILNDYEPAGVSYIVFEGQMARMERIIKRLVFALIAALVLLFSSNAFWLYEWCQYDYVSEDISLDAGYGNASFIGNDGRIYNGESTSETDIQDAPEK